jgi:D-alanyl-D-alanine carboxypeptidase (penicillin-binding protein 5/6)
MTNDTLKTSRLTALVSCLVLEAMILASFAPRAAPSAAARPPLTPLPALDAEAYVVRFAGDVSAPPLMAQRETKRVAPASLTKIMTVAVARRVLGPDDAVVFSSDAKAVENRRSGASAGEEFARDDVVRMALIESANDAAYALGEAAGARAGGGDFARRVALFVRMMNDRAQALGMRDTHFENPAGLDAPGHLTTADDLARLIDAALADDPELFAITRRSEATVFSREGKKHTMMSTNELLAEFPALEGGKTGFTDDARGALILLYPVRDTGSATPHRPEGLVALSRKRTAVIVILKSGDRFGDGRKIIGWLEDNFEK